MPLLSPFQPQAPHAGSRRLFECTWRRSCPIRPRRSGLRRAVCVALLLCLILGTGGYFWLAEEGRVRDLAERYLGELLGADVTVGEASLSLFEGLALGKVELRTPEAEWEDGRPIADADRVVFTARSVTIDYDPFGLLVGKLSASRIVALDPRVRLIEDAATGSWNAQHLGIVTRPRTSDGKPFRPPGELPAVQLRNARFDALRRTSDGLVATGSVGIEANLRPDQPAEDDAARYRFTIQTANVLVEEAGGPVALGPRAAGRLAIGGADRTLSVQADLTDADFDTLQGLLPARVAEWAATHGIDGDLAVPLASFQYDPSKPRGERSRFTLRAELVGASASLPPDPWLGDDEMLLRTIVADALTAYAADHTDPLAVYARRSAPSWRPTAIRLDDAFGHITLTQDGIADAEMSGEIEGNRLILEGDAAGYGRDTPIRLRLRTPEGDPLQLPAIAPYLASLPRQVREVYGRFRPAGTAALDFTLSRPTVGAPLRAEGTVDVIDGSFELERLPYRVHDARGTLRVAYDEQAREHDLTLERLTARGRPGGPNSGTYVRVDGRVAPLERASGLDIAILARGVRHEAALVRALPTPIRDAVRLFDPAFHDELPPGLPGLDFRGDLGVRVLRPRGRDQRWSFEVDVQADAFSGAFAAFPYPIRNAEAEFAVREDGMTLKRSRLVRDDGGTVGVAGEVRWGRSLSEGGVSYDLTLAGTALHLDEAITNALPRDAREAVTSLALGGVADVTAAIRGNTAISGGPDYDVTLDVTDGFAWPAGTTFNASAATGRVTLTPGTIAIENLVARSGEADLRLAGTIGIGDERARSELTFAADGLALDAGLYDLLPSAARDAWDWISPSGRIDAEGRLDAPTALLAGATPSADDAVDYDVTLSPQGLAATPFGLPYPFGDVRGTIRVLPTRVELDRVSARRRGAEAGTGTAFRIDGSGDLTRPETSPAGVWDLAVRADDVPVDDALLAALPDALRETAETLALGGTVSLDLPRLTMATRPPDAPPDSDFGGTLSMAGAAIEPGVSLTELTGRVDFSGSFANGELQSLSAGLRAPTFLASGRPGRNLAAAVRLDREDGVLHVADITADVAGGVLEGAATLGWTSGPDASDTPVPFDARVRVERVGVRELIGEGFGNGSVSAELQLGGNVGDPASRRGRGSLRVVGDDLYSLPLVVGLLQVTNLALPGDLAISRAGTDVQIDGERMVLSDLTISTAGQAGDEALLVGGGEFDYAGKTWRLWLRPGRGGWDKVPVLGPFADFARGELLGSEIGGTLEDPEVRAGTLPTVRATLDRTLGDEKD